MQSDHTYPHPIERHLELDRLAVISEEEAESGEEDGLEGNQQYCDMRFVGWEFAAAAVAREAALFDRFAAAADLDAEGEQYLEEIAFADSPEEDFWGLDIGVIGAVMVLSALGAVTVSSCNAGGFGGHHTEQFPLVVMFLPREAASQVLAIATEANVGLDMLQGGLVRLYGRTDFDLHRFAKVALARKVARSAADMVD